MEPEDHLTFISDIFAAYWSKKNISVPLYAMYTGRSNIPWKRIGQHADASDSLFLQATYCRPDGALRQFFVASSIGQVHLFCVHLQYN